MKVIDIYPFIKEDFYFIPKDIKTEQYILFANKCIVPKGYLNKGNFELELKEILERYVDMCNKDIKLFISTGQESHLFFGKSKYLNYIRQLRYGNIPTYYTTKQVFSRWECLTAILQPSKELEAMDILLSFKYEIKRIHRPLKLLDINRKISMEADT